MVLITRSFATSRNTEFKYHLHEMAGFWPTTYTLSKAYTAPLLDCIESSRTSSRIFTALLGLDGHSLAPITSCMGRLHQYIARPVCRLPTCQSALTFTDPSLSNIPSSDLTQLRNNRLPFDMVATQSDTRWFIGTPGEQASIRLDSTSTPPHCTYPSGCKHTLVSHILPPEIIWYRQAHDFY